MALSREQVLTATAGPELDRLVVENVCGWRPDEFGGTPLAGWWRRPDGTPVSVDPRSALCWSPSTDPRAAADVVDLMVGRNYSHAAWLVPAHSQHLPGPVAAFRHGLRPASLDTADDKNARATGLSLPEAVCRAALLALLPVAPAKEDADG